MCEICVFLAYLAVYICEMKAPSQTNGVSKGAQTALAHASQVAPTQPQQSQKKGMYQLQKLRGHHHLILHLAARGMSGKDIAIQLGVTEVTVSYTLNSELGQQKLAAIMGELDAGSIDVIQEFTTLAPVAVEVIEEVMLDGTAKHADRLNAASKILDGAGYTRRQTVEVNVHHVTDEEIKEAKIEARKRGRLADSTIEDAEVISIEPTEE